MARQLFKRQETDEAKAEAEAAREKARQHEQQLRAEMLQQRVRQAAEDRARHAERQRREMETLRAILMKTPAVNPKGWHAGDKTGPATAVEPDVVAVKVLAALRAAPHGLTRAQIRRTIFSDRIPAATVGAVLDDLFTRGLAQFEMVPTPGRHAQRWRIV
jgi:hypothetical protein